ncbi:MAG: outer membrane beta-barrel protein [bacterium]
MRAGGGGGGAAGGLFGGVGIEAATGNFDIDDKKEGDAGVAFEGHLGYAWPGGFGVGGGFSETAFAYQVQVFGQPVADLDLLLRAVDLSAWYFLPITTSDVELSFRLGLSSTEAQIKLGSLKETDSSVGVHAGFGVTHQPGRRAFRHPSCHGRPEWRPRWRNARSETMSMPASAWLPRPPANSLSPSGPARQASMPARSTSGV